MKIKQNKLVALLVCLIFVFSMSTVAYAHEVPDMNRLCSVTVTMRDGSTVVKGGSLTIYKVGEVVEHDGDYTFQPTGAFTACGESFENLDHTADMAARLQAYAQQHSIAGVTTKDIGDDGEVTFDSLTVGLYLIAQHKAAPGYAKLTPFLVSLPYLEDGEYLYDLTANPKTDLEREPEPTPPPTEPDPSLPQTGQLWWPVPVLICAGLLLFVVGMVLNRRKKSDADE